MHKKFPNRLIRTDDPASTVYHKKQSLNGVLKDVVSTFVFLKMIPF